MLEIIQFFTSYSILIYLILLIAGIFAVRMIFRGRKRESESVYGLERESSRRILTRGITALIFIVALAIVEFVVTIILAPDSPAISLLYTKTINPLASPSMTLPAELLQTVSGSTPQSQATAFSQGCIPGQIMITDPKPGATIKGIVKINGSANIPNFGFYKYEFSLTDNNDWQTIQADREIKTDTELGQWDTSEVAPGNYDLRLVVVDNQGNSLPACVVPIVIGVQ
jgi:hypothetical protein